MGEELKQTYTVRIPEQVATRIEEVARTHRITPTTLIQALIIRKFKLREGGDRETDILAEAEVAAKLETLRKSFEALERGEAARFELARHGGTVGLSGTAAEVYDVVGGHGTMVAQVTDSCGHTPAGVMVIRDCAPSSDQDDAVRHWRHFSSA